MKKILLFLCFLPMIAVAQIEQITATQKNYSVIGKDIIFHHYPAYYELQVVSDNPSEDKAICIKLGTTIEVAARSLGNILVAMSDRNDEFDLQGYKFDVKNQSICARKSGWLLDAIGNYCLTYTQVSDDIMRLIFEYGADYGNVTIEVMSEEYGDYMMYFHNYDAAEVVSFGKNISSRLSRHYDSFDDPISKEDIRLLRDIATDNYLSVKNAAHFLMICDHILDDK